MRCRWRRRSPARWWPGSSSGRFCRAGSSIGWRAGDRRARDRPTRSAGFFTACGAHFPALLRLGAIAALIYAALFRFVHPLLVTAAYDRMTLNVSAERTALLARLLVYAAFGVLLVGVNVVLDYARIRIVVEDRRSA